VKAKHDEIMAAAQAPAEEQKNVDIDDLD